MTEAQRQLTRGGESLDLSVIVVSYNTADLLRRCLRSIRESIRTISYEVIVVDNASRDGSADLVESEFPWVRLWRNRENVGFAKANNLALTLTRSRYVLLLNPDTIVVGDALERMVAFMEAHPDAGVLGCRVLDGTGKVQASTRDHYPNLWRTLLATVNVTITGGLLWIKLRERLNRHAPCWQRLVELSTLDEAYAVNRQTCVVTGCCLMARRSVFERVGLLDEHFFFGGEEMEWCYRVRKAGFEIWFTAEAEIVHYGKQSLGGSPMHRVLYYQNAHYHLGKHYGRMAALVYRLVLPPVLLTGILTHSVWHFAAGSRTAEVRKNLRAFVMALQWAMSGRRRWCSRSIQSSIQSR